MSTYNPVIGLEVHAQLLTRSKVFCACSTASAGGANTNTCPVCLGLPGALPVLNRKVVDFALMAALATNCSIAPRIEFARKNYFYADLPKGYQITQYRAPLAEEGWIEIEIAGGYKKVGLRRMNIEEDAGKSIHGSQSTMLDFNRCGIPLIEIVTEPELSSSEEAAAFVKKIQRILRYLRICDGNMEKGSLRCDANISLTGRATKNGEARVELKNMNSVRGLRRAIDYEIRRQTSYLEAGRNLAGETRLWDEAKGCTFSMRVKEECSDYRYFPEPDLPVVAIDEQWIGRAKKALPEMPDEKKGRLVREKGLSEYDANIIASDRDLAEYFESCAEEVGDAVAVSNWIINVVLGEIKRAGKRINEIPAGPQELAKIIGLVKQGTLSPGMGKEAFEKVCMGGFSADDAVREMGGQINDEDRISALVRQLLEDYPQEVAEYRAGKGKLLGFFVGRVMDKTGGRANPKLVKDVLEKRLKL